METCGLVSLEAALAGAPLVGSTFRHELEYLEGDAWYGTGDQSSLLQAVVGAWKAGRHHARPIAMKKKYLNDSARNEQWMQQKALYALLKKK